MRNGRPPAEKACRAGHPDRTFVRRLFRWYRVHHRPLPWRQTKDPYRIWVSEIMLQQTTVRAVLPYYKRWIALFPDVRVLARARLEKVLRAWQGLGYYERARNMHRTARLLVRDYGGRIPSDEALVSRLPGFGTYTTAAVMSLAYNKPLPVVDANVRRVLMRLLGIEGPARSAGERTLVARLRTFFPSAQPGLFNQAMMELGALVCRSRNPLCLSCPVRPYCRAVEAGKQDIIPEPKRRSTQKIEAAVAVIDRDKRYLIHKRPPHGLLAGLWEFPGGKLEPGERPEAALRREVREETGGDVKNVRPLTTVKHAYTQFSVTLRVYLCEFRQVPELPKDVYRWVTLPSLRRYPLPSGSVRIVDVLIAKTAGRPQRA